MTDLTLDTPAGRNAATALYTELLLEQLEVPCSSQRGFEIQGELDEMDQAAEQHGLEFDVRNSKIILRRDRNG